MKHYDLGGGRHQMVIYPEPVHYQKDGKWEEIDNRLREAEEKGRRVWRNGESPLSVELARYADDGALVRLESEGQGLSWRFQEQQAGCEAQVLVGEEEQGLSEQEKRGQVAGENARVVYEELAAGVDVMYTLEGRGLKEDIIL